ncbi:SRPBCC domain-containing protein [Octadecabacter sp. 1_MG-2023]|uniref:SRPBCC domain-containing protein n=1 Tax=unclassified Octadecabacter TaxID=196158 RepID=UPI001C088DD0|nr:MULTISPECIES: SRPBCC domain-containing protein [unclassified Octadecabacter]MBU2991857.1 SRPBCC domain-containing protein [Octadecabacter sp. B2R22]MDO6735831.1 SRPBCC domain-containing protein [Octadecabacter sp. 1_MG-2023]
MTNNSTDTFTFTRDLALNPTRMWPLLTQPDMRATWGAPGEGMVLETLSSDVRVGGTDHQRCGPADAPEFESYTRWYHLEDATRAVYTEVIEAGGMALGASLVTLELVAKGAGSSLSVTVAVSSFVGPEMIAEFQGGWTGSMENLDRLVAAQD